MRPFGVFLFCFLFIYFFFGVGCWVFISVTLVSFFFLACSASPFGWVYTCLFQYIFGSLSCRGWFFFFTFEVFFCGILSIFCLWSFLSLFAIRSLECPPFWFPLSCRHFFISQRRRTCSSLMSPHFFFVDFVFFRLGPAGTTAMRFCFYFLLRVTPGQHLVGRKERKPKKKQEKKKTNEHQRGRVLCCSSLLALGGLFFLFQIYFLFLTFAMRPPFCFCGTAAFFFLKKKRIDLFGRI